MLAQHLHDQATFCFVGLILNAYIAAINRRFASACIVDSTLKDRLECSVVELASEAVAGGRAAMGVEGVVDEERTRVERK